MMDFMGPVGMMMGRASFTPGPIVSITSASFVSGYIVGYIKSGGATATGQGTSGGTLSATILPGFVTDSVMYIPGSSRIYVYIFGDAVAALAGLSAMTIGGVSCYLAGPPAYDGSTLTSVDFFAFGAALVASTSQTIQLI